MDPFSEESAPDRTPPFRRNYFDAVDCLIAESEPEVEYAEEVIDKPVEIDCQGRYDVVMRENRTVSEITRALKAHSAECAVCGSTQMTAPDDALYTVVKQPMRRDAPLAEVV